MKHISASVPNTGAQQGEVQEGRRHHQRAVWRHPGAEVQGQTGPVERPRTAGGGSRRQAEVIISLCLFQCFIYGPNCFIALYCLVCLLIYLQDGPA